MGSGDLSADLASASLAQASAVRGAEEHSERAASQNAQLKARRKPSREEGDLDEISASSEADEPPAHQFDDMA